MSECHHRNASVFLNLTDFDDSQKRLDLLTKLAYGYISPTIIVFGIFGDLMTVYILSHPLLRKSSVIYLYLTALAVTDLFTLFSVIPMIFWLVDKKLCSYSAAVYYAHVGFPLANAFMCASVWIVVFLTLVQYVAVCHPFYPMLRSKKLCAYLTLFAYVLSFFIYIPWGFKKSVRTRWGLGLCSFFACDNADIAQATWFHVYQWVREVISRFLPFLLVAYFNARILITYRTSKEDRLSRINRVQKKHMEEKTEKEEKRLFLLLVGIISVFFFCTIPAAPLTILVSDKWSENFDFQVIRATTNILEFTKFALNFYFYCMINPDIRRLAVHRLSCKQFYKPPMVAGTPHNYQLKTLLTNKDQSCPKSLSSQAANEKKRAVRKLHSPMSENTEMVEISSRDPILMDVGLAEEQVPRPYKQDFEDIFGGKPVCVHAVTHLI